MDAFACIGCSNNGGGLDVLLRMERVSGWNDEEASKHTDDAHDSGRWVKAVWKRSSLVGSGSWLTRNDTKCTRRCSPLYISSSSIVYYLSIESSTGGWYDREEVFVRHQLGSAKMIRPEINLLYDWFIKWRKSRDRSIDHSAVLSYIFWNLLRLWLTKRNSTCKGKLTARRGLYPSYRYLTPKHATATALNFKIIASGHLVHRDLVVRQLIKLLSKSNSSLKIYHG